MGNQGSTIVDFGAAYTDRATAVVIGQVGFLVPPASLVEAWLDGSMPATADHSADEHCYAEVDINVIDPVAGVGFTLVIRARGPFLMYGKWNVSWCWN